jgi:prepilin-type processing-associated H-X9-DG protein
MTRRGWLAAALLLALLGGWGVSNVSAQGYGDVLVNSVERARRLKCVNNLKQIHLAMVMYRNDHDDAYPATFQALLDGKYVTGKVLQCPGRRAQEGRIDYGLVRTADRKFKPGDILVYDREGNHTGGRNVLLVDGQVLWLDEKAFRKRMGNEPYA